jgi:plastocyanin
MMNTHSAVMAILTLALAGCSGGEAPTDGGGGGEGPEMEDGKHVVHLTGDNSFDPTTLTIPANATVVWVVDSGLHDVTEGEAGDADHDWSSEDEGSKLAPGDRYERTFNETGTVHYRCVMHESSGMTGKITVG